MRTRCSGLLAFWHRWREARSWLAVLLLLAPLFGCGSSEQPIPGQSMQTAEIDLGNSRFSAGDHSGALEHYRAAVATDSSNASAWFGIYMASLALGDTVGAEEAMAEVQRLVPDAALQQHPHNVRKPPAAPAAAHSPPGTR